MTNNEVIASAKIFAVCRNALKKRNETDVSNAERFPLRLMSQYVLEMHARRKVTPEIQKRIAVLMDEISMETMKDEFDKPTTLEQRAIWFKTFFEEAQTP